MDDPRAVRRPSEDEGGVPHGLPQVRLGLLGPAALGPVRPDDVEEDDQHRHAAVHDGHRPDQRIALGARPVEDGRVAGAVRGLLRRQLRGIDVRRVEVRDHHRGPQHLHVQGRGGRERLLDALLIGPQGASLAGLLSGDGCLVGSPLSTLLSRPLDHLRDGELPGTAAALAVRLDGGMSGPNCPAAGHVGNSVGHLGGRVRQGGVSGHGGGKDEAIAAMHVGGVNHDI
eukprot:CAMPEP_0204578092 /NCGR_PEP_ID=MMETSP0661-20131031/42725_1 /ASSEMBLY_ACC=CAM_ASM_000606 /TAXON_ID=109239 /ORGANISM="Alexandrium margalefi, Strain AMGDE01CS-322" /LENGTH=227 /DNA_ID=CAMNT_0051586989 /DNA_START=158 /DNA_END=839 /DNA_ORIENTATION=+